MSICNLHSKQSHKMSDLDKTGVHQDVTSSEVPIDAPKVPKRYADESFKLFSKVQTTDPTPEEAQRIKKKLIWRIIPFLCVGYHLMYVDKQTVRPPISTAAL